MPRSAASSAAPPTPSKPSPRSAPGKKSCPDSRRHSPVGVPVKLYPWIPDPRVGPRRSILIDPEVSFGRPVTSLRGITTVVLADQFDAGASIEELADDYELSPEAIEDALAFERAAA
ncbi:MAG TPA: DUF433 domain-containing protein [Thermoanaerobaculia bacterium]|nr:DUF433 domain-containing protein [Thermoanaerobaculia bacterium]